MGRNTLLTAAEVAGKRIKVGSHTRKKGVMWAPALLYCSAFLAFLPSGWWTGGCTQHCMKQRCTEHPPPPSSAGSSSLVQFRLTVRLMWTDWGSVCVVYLLVFQATSFTYYSFLTAKQWGFVLSCLGECQSPSRTPTTLEFSIFTSLSLSPLWQRSSKPRYFRTVAFIFPPPPHGLHLPPRSNPARFAGGSTDFL